MTTHNPMLFEEQYHTQALEILALQALSDGDLLKAFAFADRRCRVLPPVAVHHYTLRAEITYQMGEREAAVSDIRNALALAPRDLNANRRMLAWGSEPERAAAACILLVDAHDADVLASAVAELRRGSPCPFASVSTVGRDVVGWAAWTGAAEVRADIISERERLSHQLKPNPALQPKETCGHAVHSRLNNPGIEVVLRSD